MSDKTTASVLVLGIDPGAATGIVAVELPHFPRIGDGGRVVRHAVVRASSSEKLTHAERDISHLNRLTSWIIDVVEDTPRASPVLCVALEEPNDASARFAGTGGEGAGRQRGTHMRLGVAYGLAVAAVEAARLAMFGNGVWSVTSYPATTVRKRNHRTAPRVGWMDNGGRIPAREITLAALRGYCRNLHDAETLAAASEDEIMALGVLRYHLTQLGGG